MAISTDPGHGISVRAVFAYGAALTMMPYLLIKISWVAGSLLGWLPRSEQMSVAGFVVLNLVTIAMAVTAIALALALIRPWGRRIPARAVLACAWIGCGFLVPLLPYLLIDGLFLSRGEPAGGDDAGLPGWEGPLIQGSFLGMGVGLAVAVPYYLKERWPRAFTGRVDQETAVPRRIRVTASIAVIGATVVGLLDLYWTARGTAGLGHPQARETSWYLQCAISASWCLAGAWCTWILVRARAALPVWVPVVVCWLASGLLVAWGTWKLPFAVYLAVASDADTVWPERLDLAAAKFLLSVVAGSAMLISLLRRLRVGNE